MKPDTPQQEPSPVQRPLDGVRDFEAAVDQVIGKATASVFPETVVYDPLKGYPDPSPLGTCDVIFLCVPTPTVSGRQDISIVEQALEWIAPSLRPDQVVAIRSTVLPGTTQQLQERHPHLGLAHNPEFLRSKGLPVPDWLERGLARPAVQRGLEIPKRT